MAVRRRPKPLLIFLVLFGSFLILLAAIYLFLSSPVDKNNHKDIEVVVPSGTGVSGVAEILKENNLIRSEIVFTIAVKSKGDLYLQASTYLFRQDMSMDEILSSIKNILSENGEPVADASASAEPATQDTVSSDNVNPPADSETLDLPAEDISVNDLPFSAEDDNILDLTSDMRADPSPATATENTPTVEADAEIDIDSELADKSKKGGAWMHSHWNTIRRLAVACLCIVLIAGYLCFAPAGKAFAASIAKMVMQLMDNGIRYTPTAPATSSVGEMEQVVFADFDEVQKAFDRQFLRLHGDEFTLESLILYDDPRAGKLLSAIYAYPNGLTVELQQYWDQTTSSWLEYRRDETIQEVQLWDGTLAYWATGSPDGIMTINTAWQDSIITIYADENIPVQDILDALWAE